MRTTTATRRRRVTVTAITTAGLLVSFGLSSPPAGASAIIAVTTTDQEINGDADCSLQEAIFAANLDDNVAPDLAHPGQDFVTGCVPGNGADTISLLPPFGTFTLTAPVDDPDNYVGATATPMVTSTILIEGSGGLLRHGGGLVPYRAFAVGDTGHLTLREVHVKGFEVWGGDGVEGGGGGLGAGGAVYVHGGSLVVDRSTFEQNGALGGDGGGNRQGSSTGDPATGFDSGGGGGGLGGNGGDAGLGGGGGGGSRGTGGAGNRVSCNPAPGELCEFGFGGGGGGTVRPGYAGTAGDAVGGLACGGAGAGTQMGDSGHSAPCRGGGGGAGNSGFINTDGGVLQLLLSEGGDGGAGAYGGGGGGGGWGATAILGRGTDGGPGGFGGGGGSIGGSDGASGGNGGFGGGGGAGLEGDLNIGGYGQGGTFAGDSGGNYGGGGAGLGGALFGHEATISVENSTFYNNYANRGHAGGGNANDGRDAGGAIFAVGGSLLIESSTIAGNTTGDPEGLGGGGVVVYDPEGSVEAALVLHNTILAGNGQSECYTRNGVTTTGSAGNLVTDSSLNDRGDPACPGVVESADPGLEPLALNKPGRTMTMKIATTSAAVDKAVGASPQIDQRLIPRPQGGASDIGAYEAATIPPVTAITLDPATPDGSNSWYRNPVGVSFLASDVDGTVAQTRCVLDPAAVPASFADLPDGACAISTVGTDGNHTLYAASIDADGNAEATPAAASFRIDGTAPTLNPTLSAATVVVGQTGVTAAPHASDALSGVATASCGTVSTTTPGVNTVTCTATDNAGNTRSTSLTYVVEYRVLGFFSPVPESRWRVLQTVPVKVALGDHVGTRIGDAEGLLLAASCRVTFTAEGAQPKSAQCLKYDVVADQFVYNWRLGKSPTGPTTITVAVSYPGSAVTTRLSELITITR